MLKMNMSHLTILKLSGKFLDRAIPREIASANLWIPIANTKLKTVENSFCKPKAIPSKLVWIERAVIRMKGVKLIPLFFFFKI